MRFHSAALSLGFFIVLATMDASAQAPQMLVPGRWEITLRNELPAPSPAVSYMVCIEPGAAERPQPPKGKPSDPCQILNGSVNGNVLSYATRCGSKRTSDVRITYHGVTYEGVIEVTAPEGKLRQIITARRVGACDDPLPAAQE